MVSAYNYKKKTKCYVHHLFSIDQRIAYFIVDMCTEGSP